MAELTAYEKAKLRIKEAEAKAKEKGKTTLEALRRESAFDEDVNFGALSAYDKARYKLSIAERDAKDMGVGVADALRVRKGTKSADESITEALLGTLGKGSGIDLSVTQDKVVQSMSDVDALKNKVSQMSATPEQKKKKEAEVQFTQAMERARLKPLYDYLYSEGEVENGIPRGEELRKLVDEASGSINKGIFYGTGTNMADYYKAQYMLDPEYKSDLDTYTDGYVKPTEAIFKPSSDGYYHIGNMRYSHDDMAGAIRGYIPYAQQARLWKENAFYQNDVARAMGYASYKDMKIARLNEIRDILSEKYDKGATEAYDDMVYTQSAAPMTHEGVALGVYLGELADGTWQAMKSRETVDAVIAQINGKDAEIGGWELAGTIMASLISPAFGTWTAGRIITSDAGSAGLDEGFDTLDALFFDAPSLLSDANTLIVLNKVKNKGEDSLTQSEREIYEIAQLAQEIEGIAQDMGMPKFGMRDLGKGLGYTTEIAVQMAMSMIGTGGIGTISEVPKQGAKIAIKESIKQMAKTSFKQGVKQGLKEIGKETVGLSLKLGKNALTHSKDIAKNVGIYAGRSAVGAATSPMTYNEYVRRRIGNYTFTEDGLVKKDVSWVKDLGIAYTESFYEYFSEWLGGAMADFVDITPSKMGRLISMAKTGEDAPLWKAFDLSPTQKAVMRNLGHSGVFSEPASEVLGDLLTTITLAPFSDEHGFDHFKEKGYWMNVISTTMAYGGALSTFGNVGTVKNVIDTKRYSKARDIAEKQIADTALLARVKSALAMDSADAIATELQKLQLSPDKMAEAAAVVEYITNDILIKQTLGEMSENTRMSRLARCTQAAHALTYRGVEGNEDTGSMVLIQTKDGHKLWLLAGDITDKSVSNMLKCMTENGDSEVVVLASEVDGVLGNVSVKGHLVNTYNTLFSTEKVIESLTEIQSAFNTMSNPTRDEVRTFYEKRGIRVFKEGDAVTLVDGSQGTIDGVLDNGDYLVSITTPTGEVSVMQVPVLQVLQPDAVVAEAQKVMFKQNVEKAVEDIADAVENEQTAAATAVTTEQAVTEQTEEEKTLEEDEKELMSTFPVTEDGSPDFDSISNPKQYALLFANEMGSKEAAHAQMQQMKANAVEEVEKLREKGKKLSKANDVVKNNKAIAELEARANFYDEVLKHLAPPVEQDIAENVEEAEETMQEAEETMASEYKAGDIVEHDGKKARVMSVEDNGALVIDYKMGAGDVANMVVVNAAEVRPATEDVAEQESQQQRPEVTEGLVENEFTAVLNATMKRVIDTLAKMLKVKVIFVAELNGANGQISGDTVYLSWEKRSEGVNFLVGHELLHRMKDLAPEAYVKFKKAVEKYLGTKRWKRKVAEMRIKYEATNASRARRREANANALAEVEKQISQNGSVEAAKAHFAEMMKSEDRAAVATAINSSIAIEDAEIALQAEGTHITLQALRDKIADTLSNIPAQLTITDDLMMEEVVADEAGRMAEKKFALESFVNHINDNKVLKVLRDWWARLMSLFANLGLRTEAIKAKRLVNALDKLIIAAVKAEGKVAKTGGVKHSIPSLVGVHNISLDKLRKVINMGGLANPSVAVIDVDKQSHDDYGDYSLVLPKNMVDSRQGKNAGTWAGDAWTPTYPPIIKRMSDDKSYSRFHKDIEALPEAMRNKVRLEFDSFMEGRSADPLAYWYLFENGNAPELVLVPSRYSDEVTNAISEATKGSFSMYGLTPEERVKCLEVYIAVKFNGDKTAFENDLQERIARLTETIETKKSDRVKKWAQSDIDAIKEYGFDYDSVDDFIRDVQYDVREKGTVNVEATIMTAREQIKANNLETDYEAWLNGLEERYGIEEYIFDGYTNSGNRRYLPHTLENASKWMKKQGRQGAVATFPSFGVFIATAIPKMTTLESIRKRKALLGKSKEEYDAFREKWENVYFELGKKLQPDAKGFDDYGYWRLIEAVGKNNPKEFIKKEYGIELSEEDMTKFNDMVNAIRTEYPARYFETKFERPLQLSDFTAAVVPNDIPLDVESRLKDAGVEVIEYEKGDNASRAEAMQKASQMENVRFSLPVIQGLSDALNEYKPLSERFNPKKEDIRYSISAPTFYSNAEFAVRGIKQEKATPEQWLKMIEKTGGLKAGEDKWLGLSDWLKASDKKTLTKDEVLQYIADNNFVIEEVEYGEFSERLLDKACYNLDKELKQIGIEALREKYPDVESYFELFGGEFVWSESYYPVDELIDYAIDAGIIDADKDAQPINETRLRYVTRGLDNNREIALVVPSIKPYRAFDDVHFGDAGGGRAVAWMRFGETTDAEGNRVLVIDEIQSKRHQDGREKGYKTKDDELDIIDDGEVIIATYNGRKYFFERGTSRTTIESSLGYESALTNRDGVPSAPFEKNWAELAMKRMLRYAAENGFDKVAWTTGEQQADRYGMSNYFSKIERFDIESKEGRRFELRGSQVIGINVNDEGKIISSSQEELEGKMLSDVVGKEMALKMMQMENKTSLEDVDLKVGGEGMKGFYDQMLPSFMNKYGKKWGVKVGEVTMPNLEENNTMHSVDVNDAMRESVMQGQPRFSLIGEQGASALDAYEEATTRLDNLNVAREMEAQGKDALAIKQATGWERGKDGLWRYEVADYVSMFDSTGNVDYMRRHPEYKRYKELLRKRNAGMMFFKKGLTKEEQKEFDDLAIVYGNGVQPHNSHKLKDYLDSEELFAAYPQLRDINVEIKKELEDGYYGRYIPSRNTIELATRTHESMARTLFHEVQHAIQHIEGFAQGGNTEIADPRKVRERKEAMESLQRKIDMHERTLERFEAELSELNDSMEKWWESHPEAMSRKDFDSEMQALSEVYDVQLKKAEREQNKLRETQKEYKKLVESSTTLDYEGYERLAGEVEARATARRVGMSEEERRNTLQLNDEDVARKDQIILRSGLFENYADANTRYSISGPSYTDLMVDISDVMTVEEHKAAMLENAKRMALEGVDAQKIVDETGWIELEDGWHYYGDADIVLSDAKSNMLRVQRWLESKRAVKRAQVRKLYDPLIKEQEALISDLKKGRAVKGRTSANYANAVEAILDGQAVESLPIEDQILVDIALGQKLRWEDEKNGSRRGLGSELGLANAKDEKMSGVTRGAKDYVEDYVAALVERNKGYENGIDDNDVRNAVIEAFRSYPSRQAALDELSARYPNVATTEAREGLSRLEFERDEALAEINAEHRATMEDFEADPERYMREYEDAQAWNENIDVYTQSLAKARNEIKRLERESAEAHTSAREKQEAMKALKAQIRNMLRGDVSRYLRKRDMQALMNAVNEAQTTFAMARAIEKAMWTIFDVRMRKEYSRMNNLLKMRIVLNESNIDVETYLANAVREGKVTTKDARNLLENYWKGVNTGGLVVARLIDGDTAEVVNFVHDHSDYAKLKAQGVDINKYCDELENMLRGNPIEGTYFNKHMQKKYGALSEAVRERMVEALDIVRGYLDAQALMDNVKQSSESAQISDEILKLKGEIDALNAEIEEMRKEGKVVKDGEALKAKEVAIKERKTKIAELNKDVVKARMSDIELYMGSMPYIVERMYALNTAVETLIKEGRVRFTERRVELENHKRNLINMVLEDIDRPAAQGRTEQDYTAWQKIRGAKPVDWLASSLGSFEHLLRVATRNAPNGEGAMYEYFVTNIHRASNNIYDAQQQAYEEMSAKTKALFGMSYDRVMRMAERTVLAKYDRRFDKEHKAKGERFAVVGTQWVDMTIANALDIISMWNQPNGRVTLENQGFTEEKIEAIKEALNKRNPKWLEFQQWVVNEFLPAKRVKYNNVYREMNGVDMTYEENYFPMRRDKAEIPMEVDITSPDFVNAPKSSTTTGAIIKRTGNVLPFDLSVSFFGVLKEHIVEMEEWAGMASVTRDLNMVLSSPAVRKALEAVHEGFYKTFADAAKAATNNYTDPTSEFDRAFTAVAQRMWAPARLAWKAYTALKQLASAILFLPYARDAKFIGRLLWYYTGGNIPLSDKVYQHIAHGANYDIQNYRESHVNITWALENSAMFRKRWASGAAGNNIFTRDMVYGEGKTRLGRLLNDILKGVDWVVNMSMRGIALVDAFTSAAGMRAIYEQEMVLLQEGGMSKEEAHEVAMLRAEIAVNKTQQSAENLYLAPVQKNRGAIATMLTMFQNATFAQGRNITEATRELTRDRDAEHAYLVSEEMKRLRKVNAHFYEQIEDTIKKEKEQGIITNQKEEDMRREQLRKIEDSSLIPEAEKRAKKKMHKAKTRALFTLFMNAWIGPAVFNAMQYLPYLLMGDDDEEKKKMLKMIGLQTALGPIGALPLGNTLISGLMGYGFDYASPITDTTNDLEQIWKVAQEEGFNVDVAMLCGEWLLERLAGVDLQTFEQIYSGVESMIEDGYSREAVLNILGSPKSQVRLLAYERKEGETYEEYATRIMRLYTIFDTPTYYDYYDENGKYIGGIPFGMKEYMLKDMSKEYEKAYRRDVLSEKAYDNYLSTEELYDTNHTAMGWSKGSNPSKKAYENAWEQDATGEWRFEPPVMMSVEEYSALYELALTAIWAEREARTFVGQDEDEYRKLVAKEVESKDAFNKKFSEITNK